MSELDSILSGDTTEAVEETETTEVVETTGEEAPKETEKEPKEQPKEEDSTPEPKEDSKSDWQYQAYKDEKRKRQEAEEKLKAFEVEKKPVTAPDVFENQDVYNEYLSTQMGNAVDNVKTEISQFHAEKEHGKEVVAEKLETFKQMLNDDPTLGNLVQSSASPYDAMIDMVNKAEKLKQFDNVEAMEEKMRVEIEAKVRKEIAEETGQKQTKQDSVTPSLNSQRSADGGNTPAGDLTLGEILGR